MQVPEQKGDTEPEERPARQAGKRAVLLVASSDGLRIVAPLPVDGAATIGRAPGDAPVATADGPASSTLLPDGLLSRQHLRIAHTERGYEAADLESRNGTLLDGRRLQQPTRLSDGCILLFGGYVGVFRLVTDAELAALRLEADTPFGPVATFSPALALTYERLRKLARTDTELLLAGETGVGKEVCARAIHQASGRAGAFITVNCAALPATLVESDLFGHVAGAYSTAKRAKPGLVEAADGGTLLLDEIGEAARELQAKIFRFLQDRTYMPLGATRVRRADVRVLAATTRTNIGPDGKALRPDLVARLGAEPITIPALRRRAEEIAPLVAHFSTSVVRRIEPAALRAMALYGWPLNVRELEKTLANAIALSSDGELLLENLPGAVRGALERGAPIEVRPRKPRAAPDRQELEQILKQHEGNVASVARALDRQWNVVWRWMAKHGLRPEGFRKKKEE
ncbi:MAG TPA: sigma 54-interacting transcriptional regulator [Polyangia bacterium]